MFIGYTHQETAHLAPMADALLLEYITGSNGVFVRSERSGLRALIPVLPAPAGTIRGLVEIEPFVRVQHTVPAFHLQNILLQSLQAMPDEALFYLEPTLVYPHWNLNMPPQVRTPSSVEAVDPRAGDNALIEVHSHSSMAAFSSRKDDEEEAPGFRIYAVLGNLPDNPTIQVRVGVFGHFWEIPANWIFDLLGGIHDASKMEDIDELEPRLRQRPPRAASRRRPGYADRRWMRWDR